MNKKLFIKNIPFGTKEKELQTLFERHGEVIYISIPTEHNTNRQRGFAFIEFSNEESAKKAIDNLHEFEFNGRQLCVTIAEERQRGRGGRW